LKLFEIVPQKFFSILASIKKENYSDCLFVLYRVISTNTSFGVDREIVVQALTDYFEGLEEKNIFQEEDESVKTSREEANFIIRKLEECGWIGIETTTSYHQFINFTDYAVAILETLDKLMKNERLEYQGYVYTIYSILFNSENTQHNIMLDQVFENTNKLINGLKTLNANIKKYIEEITKTKTAEEIMKLHFEGYAQDIIDKGYHRLKTSDNVSKFRPRIIDKLEEIKRNKELIQIICRQNIQMEKYPNAETANDGVHAQLNHIINSFYNMDQIIHEIDRKNAQYIRSSLTRVKYLLNSSKDLGGQITEILKYMVKKAEEDDLDSKEDYIDEIEQLFSFFPQSFIDEKSIYVSTEGKKSFVPQSIDIENGITKKEREERIRALQERNRIRMSRENVDRYVLGLLKGNTSMNASMIPLEETRDFVRLIYILVYSKSKLVHYKIKKLNQTVNINGFSFHDFEIWRK